MIDRPRKEIDLSLFVVDEINKLLNTITGINDLMEDYLSPTYDPVSISFGASAYK